MVGQNRESCAVILDGRTNKEGLYYVNNSIQGARIVNVMTDRVMIIVDNKEEALILSYDKDSKSKMHRSHKKKLRRKPPRQRK